MLCLQQGDEIGRGAGATVYRHPDDPTSLIKVTRPPAHKSLMWLRRLFESRRRKYGRMYLSLIELEEYFLAVARTGDVPPFMPEFRGVVQTNLGAGLVFEAIFDEDGNLAATLGEHARRQGVSEDLRGALRTLFDQIAAWRLVAWDLTPKNIVFGRRPGGPMQMFLVDGIAERTFIRILSMSDTAYHRNLARKYDTLLHRIESEAPPRTVRGVESCAVSTWTGRKALSAARRARTRNCRPDRAG